MRSASDRVRVAVGVGVAIGLAAPVVRADSRDATYGRIDGDVSLVVGAGAVLGPRAPRVEGELRVRYLETGGVYLVYEDDVFGGRPEPARVLATGVELRPLFLARWLRGLESDGARLDLVLDSLGLQIGAAWTQPRGHGFGASVDLDVGLAVEVPLCPRATGPWIAVRAGMRWSEAALATGLVRDADDRAAYLAFSLAWHELVPAHVVDLGDEAPR